MAFDKKDRAINYFKKVDNEITKINKSDDFKLRFLLALSQGEMNLSHQSIKTNKVYKDDWVSEIEKAMPFIENIVREPKKFIKREELIVPVELARKTGKESIQHLLANTHFIDEVNEETGDVRPSKILTINREEDYTIYENRFIKMLVLRLQSFVEHRYRYLNDRINGVNQNIVTTDMDVNLGDAKVKCKIEFEISYEAENEEAFKEYRKIVSRIEMQRMSLFRITESEFMRELKNAKPILGQIQRTNILTKEINYASALDLWEYMGQYEGTGFDVEVTQDVVNFDDAYKDQMYNLVMLGYTTTKYNIDKANQEFDDGFESKITRTKTISPRIDRVFLEVEEDYVYEEEILIPTKLELLRSIHDEQKRLTIELERQNQLEAKAKERLAELRKLYAAKVRKERAAQQAKFRREQRKELTRIKKEEEEKILGIVRAKELKKKEINNRLKQQNEIVKEIKDEINMFKETLERSNFDESKLNEQMEKAKERIKHFKNQIRNNIRLEFSKDSYYKALFRSNGIKSKQSDLNILRREYNQKIEELTVKLRKEQQSAKNIKEELKNI